MIVENNPIKIQILDTSGEKKFKVKANNFYRGAHGVLLVYKIYQKNSFLDVKIWTEQTSENSENDDIVMILQKKKEYILNFLSFFLLKNEINNAKSIKIR